MIYIAGHQKGMKSSESKSFNSSGYKITVAETSIYIELRFSTLEKWGFLFFFYPGLTRTGRGRGDDVWGSFSTAWIQGSIVEKIPEFGVGLTLCCLKLTVSASVSSYAKWSQWQYCPALVTGRIKYDDVNESHLWTVKHDVDVMRSEFSDLVSWDWNPRQWCVFMLWD